MIIVEIMYKMSQNNLIHRIKNDAGTSVTSQLKKCWFDAGITLISTPAMYTSVALPAVQSISTPINTV